MTKTLNQIIFFSHHQNQNIFFSNIGNQNIFLEKNHNPPPPFKLNGPSLSNGGQEMLLSEILRFLLQMRQKQMKEITVKPQTKIKANVNLSHGLG
jgi:hypothetical protein